MKQILSMKTKPFRHRKSQNQPYLLLSSMTSLRARLTFSHSCFDSGSNEICCEIQTASQTVELGRRSPSLRQKNYMANEFSRQKVQKNSSNTLPWSTQWSEKNRTTFKIFFATTKVATERNEKSRAIFSPAHQ